MNLFRIIADLLHVASLIILLRKIRTKNSVAGRSMMSRITNIPGISRKSQELFALVFTCRYLDLFWNFSSLYNSVLKIVFLGTSYLTVYWMRTTYRASYDKEHDSFRVLFLIAPCALLALLIHDYEVTWFQLPFEVLALSWLTLTFSLQLLWTFSIYLEAVAILPQLFLIQRTGEAETFTSNYVFCMGAYRGFYLFNWIYRWITEPHYSQWIVWLAGMVQTVLYCDFFYYYVRSRLYGSAFKLPK